MKKYKMMTAAELVHYLFTKDGEKVVNFTFDDLELDPDCEPEGWCGVQLINIFDEWNEVFAVGYWGGGSTQVYDTTWDDTIGDREKECTKFLEQYIINQREYEAKSMSKICVEIKSYSKDYS